MEVLPQLPRDMSATVFLVQHMPVSFTNTFARRLNEACELTVVEAESGMEVQPGYCYVARGDAHLTLYKKLTGQVFVRMPTTPQTLFVPSVNVMMESVLAVYGRETIGVLMTGIGGRRGRPDDADQGSGRIYHRESEESCVVYGMPREADRARWRLRSPAELGNCRAVLRRL